MHYLKWFFVRMPMLYMILFLCSLVMIDQSKIKAGGQIRVLNRIMPTSEEYQYLVEIVAEQKEFDKAKLQKYVQYYEEVIEFQPDSPDGYGMLGFCYYRQKRYDDAIKMYEKAITLNKHFFWYYYNLGIIYFEKEDYLQSIVNLQKALEVQLERSIMFIRLSKMIYHPIVLNNSKKFGNTPILQLREGYQNAQLLLIRNYKKQKEYSLMFRGAITFMKTHPENIEFFYYAGVAAYELKQYAQAAGFLQQYIQKDPLNVEALRYLGLALKMLGKEKIAAIFLTKAVRLHKASDQLQSRKTLQMQPY